MKKNWVELYKKYGIYILLVVVFAFFAVAAPNFLAAKNVINILRQVSMFGIVVVGVCMVMIGGGMDLSVGMQMAVDGMLIGYMMVNLNVPIPLAVIITIVVGCLLGAANGIIAVKMHIAPIIVTLGTMLVLQGVAYLITGGYPITGMPEAFKVIGQGYVGIIPVPVIIFVLFIYSSGFKAECYVISYAKPRKQCILLKHKASVRTWLFNILSVKSNLSAVFLNKPCYKP